LEALFTSLVGGNALRQRILDVIADALVLTKVGKVDVHVMMFAFTDEAIADALADAADRCPGMTIRILADWSQRIRVRSQQVGRLARLGLHNLHVRYKRDQPYLWDSVAGHMRWSYHTSHGLLHHKTLSVLLDGHPRQLICGSFNWTASAARSYENLLIVAADEPESCRLMARVQLEFEALWSDGHATFSPDEAHLHYRAILDQYRREPHISPASIRGLSCGSGASLRILSPDCYPTEFKGISSTMLDRLESEMPSRIAIAFSARGVENGRAQCGYARSNRDQRFFRFSPSSAPKRVPLTITNLALDMIFRSAPGETLKIAMYGLSARVPEYGALLDAARRGVHLLIILDGAVNSDAAARLMIARETEGLSIEVRTASRMMHQKYIVSAESATVLTGTANMTTDASSRHLEHRILISRAPKLAAQYCSDFDKIWNVLLPRPNRHESCSTAILQDSGTNRKKESRGRS
jgi:phosphatidylserine/phosphatidylglycerophosphate/cardiolipin synthase-like enzyme